jgi:pre-mRNA-splicing helicase BRR2
VESDDCLLLSSAPGTGRFLNALLLLNQSLQDQGKCLVLVGREQSVFRRYELLSGLFGDKAGRLVGQVPADSEVLLDKQLIVAGPESWDILTRRWRARKGLTSLTLVVL